MDFPSNVVTNIHSLHLNQIRWTVYRLDEPDPANAFDADGEAPVPKRSIGEISHALRRNGFLATASREVVGFWNFDVTGSGPEPSDTQQANIAKIIGHRGFKFIKTGILTSQQLKSMVRDTPTTRSPSNEQRAHPESSQPQSTFPHKTINDLVPYIYRAFTLALSSSLLYSLVSGGDWLPFGNDSCLRIYQNPTGWATMKSTAERLRLDVRWSPSGILTIGSRLTPLPSFSPLSDVLEQGQGVDKKSLHIGVPVFVSPFGARCTLLGEESQILGKAKADRRFKTSTRAWLESYGIATKREVLWVCLQIRWKSSPNSIVLNGQAVCQIWWPADLCFIKDTGSKLRETNSIENIGNGTFVNPLEEAEQWFLGRKERDNVIEARRKEVDERKLHNNKPPNDEEDELEEDAADPLLRANQYLSAQEASGIYPTPPDVLGSNAQGSVAAQDTPGASIPGGHPHQAIVSSEATDGRISDIDSRAPFAEDESQDLFGDMDTDMFDPNGLTEADFNFFDEPNEEVDRVAHDDCSQPNVQNPGNAEPDDRDREIGCIVSSDGFDPEVTQLESQKGLNASEEDTSERHVSLPLRTPPVLSDDSETVLYLSEKADGIEQPVGDLRAEKLHRETVEPQMPCHDGKRSSFGLAALDNPRDSFSQKYGCAGKYAASSPRAQNATRPSKDSKDHNHEIPILGLLLDGSEDSSEETDLTETDHQSLTDWENDGVGAGITGPANVDMGSDEDLNITKKRKRELSVESNAPATPASVPAFQETLDTSTNLNRCMEQWYFDYGASDDITGSSDDELVDTRYRYVGNDQVFIQIAQLVADQAVLRNGVSHMPPDPMDDDGPSLSNPLRSEPASIHEVLLKALPGVQQCDLKSFSELDMDAATSASQKTTALHEDMGKRRQALLQARAIKSPSELMFETRVPYLNIKRGQDALDIAPPALYFWEELGLAPWQQKRDVEALCIYPDNAAIRGAASTFMTTLQNSYQSCKFGSHQPSSGPRRVQEGLLPVPITSRNPDVVLDSLGETCEAFAMTVEQLLMCYLSGMELPLKEADGTNIVIYIVDPFNDEAMYPHICAAFLELFAAYASSAKKAGLTSTREIVLQIVPLSFLASSEFLTIPSPKAYTKLAFEVYSRCSPGPRSDGTLPTPFTSGSAIRLAKPIPKTVNFQLSSQTPGLLLSSDPCLHLAYSWDTDQQWLACAWIDNLGATRWNATYCLGDPNPDYWAAFAETVKEVLATTREMLQPVNILWKLHIVKDNSLRQRELEIWRLHSTSFSRQQMSITILSIDIDPPLSFLNGRTTVNVGLPTSPLDTTPAVFTPNEQMPTSDYPSPTVNPTPGRGARNPPVTPSATGFSDKDASARLIDIVSQTWAMISPTPGLDPYLPRQPQASVLASGYLFKRAGAEDNDRLVPLGVNVIATNLTKAETGNGRTHTKMLTEILEMYSDLGMLARLRGLEEWRVGVLPWHVAAARKAKKAVTRSMQWGQRKD
ncbi:MAG: hypothetical protein Q9178_008086 [Gyalolechia marmorata]